MAEVCAYSDLPVASCAHCQGAGHLAHEREPDSRPFAARLPGECAGCGFDIKPGETVQFAHGGRLYHLRCTHG